MKTEAEWLAKLLCDDHMASCCMLTPSAERRLNELARRLLAGLRRRGWREPVKGKGKAK